MSDNYNFNSDTEIPLEVLRQRYFGKRPSDVPSYKRAGAGAVSKAIRSCDIILLLSTIFLSIASIFGLVSLTGYDGALPTYKFIFNDEYQFFENLFSGFASIEVDSFGEFVLTFVPIVLLVTLYFNILSLLVGSFVLPFVALSHFVKNESCEIAKSFMKLVKNSVAIFVSYSLCITATSDSLGGLQIGEMFKGAFAVAIISMLAVSLIKYFVRRKNTGFAKGLLPLHFVSLVCYLVIITILTANSLFNYFQATFSGFVYNTVLGGTTEGIVVGIICLAMGVLMPILLGIVSNAIYKDGFRLTSFGDSLKLADSNFLWKLSPENKHYKFLIISSLIMAALTIVLPIFFPTVSAISAFSDMFIWIFVASALSATIYNFFKKA